MDFNSFLTSLVNVGQGKLSDLHFRVGKPPLLRSGEGLIPARFAALGADDTKNICAALMQKPVGEIGDILDWDGAYTVPGQGRFRVNIFRQQETFAAILRVISTEIPTVESLGLPEVVSQIAMEERGMVLVTGVTGSGKSSTLAAMINHVNHNKTSHVLTIEDPVEFIYQSEKSSICQREVGKDTGDFPAALRAALRQDPDIILVGEMRDPMTITTAIKAAETGHLVFSTLHTVD
ncbi:MAG: ATPase, T2SS/T4P/T4SS family, partial [Acidobacteriota bacterium]